MAINRVEVFNSLKNTFNYSGRVNLFFLCFSVWLLLLLCPLLFLSNFSTFTAINHSRSYPADILFTFFTFLGNGIILIPLTCYFLYKKKYCILIGLLISILINTLFVTILKQSFNAPRPLALFGADIVQSAHWIKILTKHSFPSGHTASAFCMAAYLSLAYYKLKWLALITFISAALTGYSRVYLGEHFLGDVWFGSIIGVFTSLGVYISVQYGAGRILRNRQRKQGLLVKVDNIEV